MVDHCKNGNGDWIKAGIISTSEWSGTECNMNMEKVD